MVTLTQDFPEVSIGVAKADMAARARKIRIILRRLCGDLKVQKRLGRWGLRARIGGFQGNFIEQKVRIIFKRDLNQNCMGKMKIFSPSN
jgi:hypothetical protein